MWEFISFFSTVNRFDKFIIKHKQKSLPGCLSLGPGNALSLVISSQPLPHAHSTVAHSTLHPMPPALSTGRGRILGPSPGPLTLDAEEPSFSQLPSLSLCSQGSALTSTLPPLLSPRHLIHASPVLTAHKSTFPAQISLLWETPV